MSFLRQIFGLKPPKAASSSSMSSQLSPATSSQSKSSASSVGNRRELLRLVLRNTLNRHGIPATWVGADVLTATSPGREPGVHLRLLIQHWDPRLLTYAVALQNSLIVRLLAFDPLASNWLMGITWQFALPDEAACPPMPHAGWWTAEADPRARATAGVRAEVAGGSGDVIAGPVRIGPDRAAATGSVPSADVKADLERLLAVRDAEHKLNSQRLAGGGAAAHPVYLKTQPMDLDDLRPLERDA